MQYYIIINGQQVGPMDKEQLLNYGLAPNSIVWHQGLTDWTEACNIQELMMLLNPAPVEVNEWYIITNGQQVGPISYQDACNIGLAPDSMVWKEGMTDWACAANMPEFSGLFVQQSLAQPNSGTAIFSEVDTFYGEKHEPAKKGRAMFSMILGILCCANVAAIVLAVISMKMANAANTFYDQGNIVEGEAKERTSNKLSLFALLAALIMPAFCLLYFILMFLISLS